MRSVSLNELHVTVNNITILNNTQKFFYGEFMLREGLKGS